MENLFVSKLRAIHVLTIPFLPVYQKELKMVSQIGIYTPKFIAVLFTIVKIQKEGRCPK